jgi:chromosome segregation ATPase
MQPTSTNGVQTSAQEALDSLRQVIERLEADLKRQQQEIQELRRERDDYRAVVYEHLKKQFDPKDWDDFDEKDFTLTLDDLLAVVRGK